MLEQVDTEHIDEVRGGNVFQTLSYLRGRLRESTGFKKVKREIEEERGLYIP